MPHYKDFNDPLACLFGKCLKGNRNKLIPQKGNRLRISSFYCEIENCPDNNCRQMALVQFGQYGLKLHGNADDSMSGHRGFIEPSCGYKGPGYSEDKSPKKDTTHNPSFKLHMSDNCPAVCYFDTLQTQTISIKIQLKKVQTKD